MTKTEELQSEILRNVELAQYYTDNLDNGRLAAHIAVQISSDIRRARLAISQRDEKLMAKMLIVLKTNG